MFASDIQLASAHTYDHDQSESPWPEVFHPVTYTPASFNTCPV